MRLNGAVAMCLAAEDGGAGSGPSEAVRNLVAQLSTDDLSALLKELRTDRHEQSTYLHGLIAIVLDELGSRDR